MFCQLSNNEVFLNIKSLHKPEFDCSESSQPSSCLTPPPPHHHPNPQPTPTTRIADRTTRIKDSTAPFPTLRVNKESLF